MDRPETCDVPRAEVDAADAAFMRRAIALARDAAQEEGAAPIGCVIVRDGVVIGEGGNEVGPQTGPTAHAEMVAIRRVARAVGPDLRDATPCSTSQPCGMCTMASIWAQFGHVIYSAERHQVHSMYFEYRHFYTMSFISDALLDARGLAPGRDRHHDGFGHCFRVNDHG